MRTRSTGEVSVNTRPKLRFALVAAICASALITGLGGASAQEAESRGKPVTVADLNLLHGLFCDADATDWCNAPARVEILGKWLERSNCPDLVGLQEIAARQEELLNELVTDVCDGEYEIGFEGVGSPDQQMVLTKLPVLEQGYLDIANFPWEAYWVRVDAPMGPVDFLTAHFASGANNPPCTADNCPPVCATGIETNLCHAHEVVDFFASRDDAVLTIVGGDLNARPDEPTLETLYDADFVDAWVEADRRECDPATGRGCTGCSDLESTFIGMETREGLDCGSRIDFVLVRPGAECALATKAKGFAHKPLKRPVDGMYWPSDHRGVQASLRCS
jgi:endonuclease/exonuclease/phosphatase family metal-dependent hydrolase